ncbi:hypothetical protein [Mesorhizobium sp.]|uniref:hypothetical protein n=1 Tax=Mesorhizobium sp. TaxID=1871066 RepID=UPI0025F55CBF|nr:hypothetical protein [Mesorhizobium sp.]
MLTKILAASVFTIGLATSAMAQSSDVLSNSPAPTNPVPTNEERMTADPSATGSINGDASGLNIQGNRARLDLAPRTRQDPTPTPE